MPAEQGWTILLDDRPVRTPARQPLIVGSAPLAEAIAAEWQAQDGEVRPLSMPLTRSANAAIDKVIPQRAEVIDYLLEYGGTDLICYRADGPAALIERQAEAWDPLLAWAKAELHAPLVATSGIVPVMQPQASLDALRRPVERCDAFALTALHDLVLLSGSLVIGLAALSAWRPAETLWALSRIDEDWQTMQWGEDAEARTAAEAKRAEFLHAAHFHALSQAGA